MGSRRTGPTAVGSRIQISVAGKGLKAINRFTFGLRPLAPGFAGHHAYSEQSINGSPRLRVLQVTIRMGNAIQRV